MAKKNVKRNPRVIRLIDVLMEAYWKNKAPVWKKVAEELQRSRSHRNGVNVGKVDKILKEGEIAVIIGKALGGGYVTRPITVAALGFSEKAKKKIEEKGGKCLMIEELLEQNPKGSNVRIFG